MKELGEVHVIDYLVIGAGPAGLQLGYFLRRARRSHLILEAGPAPGTFFRTFPRHRRLISINKPRTGTTDPELNLRMDGNSLLSDDPELLFTRYTNSYLPHADDLLRYLKDFADGLDVRYGTRAVRIARDGHFEVLDQHGETHAARRLIVATGMTKPFLPGIPGIETVERYGTVTTNPTSFTDQRVLIIGTGDSALETADHLVETAAVIHLAGRDSIRTHQPRNAVLDGQVLGIVRDEEGYRVSFSCAKEVVRYDRVIACTGFRFNADLFASNCRPQLDGRFPALTPQWESVNIPDLYFAGTLMQSGGSIHGFRYCVRAQQRILDRKYHGVAWPGTRLPNRPESITSAILKRVNRSSGLWHQAGRLGDLVVTSCGHATYYEEVPVGDMPPTGFVVTLEQELDVAHPVVRYYRGGELVGTHHVAGNLENDWTDREAHRLPLERFLVRQLAVPAIA